MCAHCWMHAQHRATPSEKARNAARRGRAQTQPRRTTGRKAWGRMQHVAHQCLTRGERGASACHATHTDLQHVLQNSIESVLGRAVAHTGIPHNACSHAMISPRPPAHTPTPVLLGGNRAHDRGSKPFPAMRIMHTWTKRPRDSPRVPSASKHATANGLLPCSKPRGDFVRIEGWHDRVACGSIIPDADHWPFNGHHAAFRSDVWSDIVCACRTQIPFNAFVFGHIWIERCASVLGEARSLSQESNIVRTRLHVPDGRRMAPSAGGSEAIRRCVSGTCTLRQAGGPSNTTIS